MSKEVYFEDVAAQFGVFLRSCARLFFGLSKALLSSGSLIAGVSEENIIQMPLDGYIHDSWPRTTARGADLIPDSAKVQYTLATDFAIIPELSK